jgi:hypothetical protein
MIEKSCQLQQRNGLGVPELQVADDGGVEGVQLRVESLADKRRLHV